jgi:hypothetical protein
MRSRASKISNLCKSLIAAVALFGAAVSNFAGSALALDPGAWPPGAALTAPNLKQIYSSGSSGPQKFNYGTGYWTPVYIPAGSYVKSINIYAATGGNSGDKLHFAIYTPDSGSTVPYALDTDFGTALIPTSGGPVTVSISPAWQNVSSDGYFWLYVTPSQPTTATFVVALESVPAGLGSSVVIGGPVPNWAPPYGNQGETYEATVSAGTAPSTAPSSGAMDANFTYMLYLTH